MEKKYLRKFIALFDSLPEADLFLSVEYDCQPEVDLIQSVKYVTEHHAEIKSNILSANATNQGVLYDDEKKLLTKLYDEIDNNLYNYPLSREVYVKDLLRAFIHVAPFLDTKVNYKDYEFRLNCPVYTGAARKVLGRFTKDPEENFIEFSEVEEYVLSCFELLSYFADYLDSRCLHFYMDLFEIQEDINIFINRYRINWQLEYTGLDKKSRQILMKEERNQEALSLARPPIFKTIKNFPAHLIHKQPLKLAAVCKNLFNLHESPKDYAIMLCLLVEHKYTSIQDRKRSDFFRSWYSFINREIPSNFEAENKYIDVTKDGTCFYNDNDVDYKGLKKFFNESLQELKNTVA